MAVAPADMILFASVVRARGFTPAARLLGITKQSASERVARLEQQLGVRLLERTTRAMRLTDAGAEYFEQCAAIAAQIDDANARVQHRQAAPSGRLRVSAPVLYGRRFLAQVVTDYVGRHPGVRVEIMLADRRVNLIEEGFDVAIRIGVLDDSSLSARKLGEGHTYVVASPRWIAQHGTPAVDALGGVPSVGTRTKETWEIGGARVRVDPVLVVNDLEVTCEAAQAGVGAAMLPGIVCRDAVQAGRLRVLFGPEPAIRRSVYALFPSRQHLPTKVRVFLDMLGELIEPMQPLRLAQRRARG